MQINDFFQGKHYSVVSLLTDEDEHTLFGLEIMNYNN